MKKITSILFTLVIVLTMMSVYEIKGNESDEFTIVLDINGINSVRYTNQLIYYDSQGYKDGKSPANGWGYEVSVNNSGYIAEVGSNVAAIEDGYILSGHGTKKTILMELKVGDKVVVDLTEMIATVTRSFKDSSYARAKINYDNATNLYNGLTSLYLDYKNDDVEKLYEEIQASFQIILDIYQKEELTTTDKENLSKNESIISKNTEQMIYLTSYTNNVDLRAIWHRPRASAIDESTLDGVKTFLQRVKDCGFNVIFLETYWNGYTTGKSEFVLTHPRVSGLDMGEYGDDYLKAFVTEANKIGIDVHAWCHTFNAGSQSYLSSQIKDEWLLETYTGTKLHANDYNGAYYLDPSNDEVINYMANVYIELLSNYDLKGLQLDYIRYWDNDFNQTPYRDSGYGALPEAKFLSETGLTGDVREIVKTVKGRETWNDWRCNNITEAVKKLSEAIYSVDSNLIVSAAVVPSISQAKSMYMQDLYEWTSNGYVDLLCPMIYTGSVNSVINQSNDLINLVDNMTFISSGIAPLYYGYSNMINHQQMEAAMINSIGVSHFASQNIFTSSGELSEFEKAIIEGVYRQDALNPLSASVEDVMDNYYKSLYDILKKIEAKGNFKDKAVIENLIVGCENITPNNPKDYQNIIDQLVILKAYSQLIKDEFALVEFERIVSKAISYLEVKINRYLIINNLWEPETSERPDLDSLEYPVIEEPDDPNQTPDDDPNKTPVEPVEKGCTKSLMKVLISLFVVFSCLIVIRKFK